MSRVLRRCQQVHFFAEGAYLDNKGSQGGKVYGAWEVMKEHYPHISQGKQYGEGGIQLTHQRNLQLRPYQINYLFIIPSLSNFWPKAKNLFIFCACARCALIRIKMCINQKLTGERALQQDEHGSSKQRTNFYILLPPPLSSFIF